MPGHAAAQASYDTADATLHPHCLAILREKMVPSSGRWSFNNKTPDDDNRVDMARLGGALVLAALLLCASTSHAVDGARYAPVPLQPEAPSEAAEAPSAPAEHTATEEEAPELHGRGSLEQLVEAAEEATASMEAAEEATASTAAAATTPAQADAPSPASPTAFARAEAGARPDGSPPPGRRLDLGVALRAARPWSFTASATPILYGSALAFKLEDAFSPAVLGLSLLTAVSVHAAGECAVRDPSLPSRSVSDTWDWQPLCHLMPERGHA
jgi:hypothetical protein